MSDNHPNRDQQPSPAADYRPSWTSSDILHRAAALTEAVSILVPDRILSPLIAIPLAARRPADDLDGDALIAAARLAEWLGFPDDMPVNEALGEQWAGRPEQNVETIVAEMHKASAELAGAGL